MSMPFGEGRSLYLMRRGGLHKIGVSQCPEGRAEVLAMDGLGPITLLHAIRCARPFRVETALKRRFSTKHVGGEWFRLDEEDVAAILALERCDRPEDLPAELRPRLPARFLTVAVPEGVYQRLLALADQGERSLGDELLLLVEQHVANPTLPKGVRPSSIDHPARKGRKRNPPAEE